MKAIHPILIGFCLAGAAFGQESGEEKALSDKVQNAIREFNRTKNNDKPEENEVVVVLPPPEPESADLADDKDAAEEPKANPGEPRLVTGKPPLEVQELVPDEKPDDAETPVALQDAAVEDAPVGTGVAEKQGLEVRVESIREGTSNIDPGLVKLKASFPAKSLSAAPEGWLLEKSAQAPVFSKEITLRPGKTITLSIQPHILSPAADGANTFAVVEPGFNISEGYRQSNTVSAILGNSVAQLDRDALLLGNAISDLHQLLASLPKTEPKPEDIKKP